MKKKKKRRRIMLKGGEGVFIGRPSLSEIT
jgi:hypothetical protein